MTDPPGLTLPRERVDVLLLEGIHDSAVARFQEAGYTRVERLSTALTPGELRARIAGVHIVGVRSRSRLTEEVLRAAPRLFAVGCFCIGTNQVALDAARALGVPVFNAPYSNTRSVAELVIGELIMLQRRVPQKSALAHAGVWAKSAAGAHEVRGRTLGIVGYGHIGSQVSVLAEAMGLRVIYHDIVPKLSLGNARPCATLGELLRAADMVTLHVPATEQTRGLFDRAAIAAMRPGAMLINASRGDVVDLDALADAIRDGRLGGAAVDVYPVEPSSKGEPLRTPLRGLDNVILTPHVGGSTQEAQAAIGEDVAGKLIRYSDVGDTVGAVNFAEVSLPEQHGVTRFLHIHRDEPGVLAAINRVFSSRGLNIAGEYLRTEGRVGYVVVDVHGRPRDEAEVLAELRALPDTLRARLLH